MSVWMCTRQAPTFAIVASNGKRLGTHVVETNGQALVERLKTIPGTLHVRMEEGTQSAWLYETSAAIGFDGTNYVGSGGRLDERNPDGTLKWAFETGGKLSSPAIGADGTVYFGSDGGFVHALSPEGTMKWSFKTGDYGVASFAIGADGTLYVASADGKLYAFGP